jgi:hypothetical protein
MLRSAISAFTRVFDALCLAAWCAADPGSIAPAGSAAWVPALRSSVTGRCYASPGARCTASGTREEIALRGRVVICPSGGLWTGVSSPLCKNILVFTYPKSLLELFASHPTRGAFHDRHERRGGMRWTRQRLARDGIAGLVERLVSDHRRADERCCCGRQNRVVLTPRRWRQVRGVLLARPGSDKTLLRGRRWQKSPT